MIEHRVWQRGRPRLRRYSDPAASADPRIRSVVAQLESLRDAPAAAPDQVFRDELRAQLVAIAPRIVAEGEPATARPRPVAVHRAAQAVADRPRPARTEDDSPAPRRSRERLRIPIARPLAIVATMITVLGLVLGASVWMSQSAVPGDALYGLKRASERFELSVAGSDTDRAQDHLDFARERIREAQQLAARPSATGTGVLADGLSGETSNLIADALGSADGDVRTASQLLGTVAVDDGSGRALDPIVDWLPGQRTSMTTLWSRLPAGSSARDAALRSVKLLDATKTRAAALQKAADCKCLKNARRDSLGPVPTTAGSATATNPGSTRTTRPNQPAPGRSTGGTAPRPTTPGTTPAVPAPSTTPGGGLPRLPLPSLFPKRSSSTPGSSPSCYINLLGIKICPGR